MNSMVLIEDSSDDDISCNTYSNSAYNSFWSIQACMESPYSSIWNIDRPTSSRDSLCTSIWSVDTSIDSLCPSTVSNTCTSIWSVDSCIDSLCTSTVNINMCSSIWSITSLEGDWDTGRDFVFERKSEEEFDINSNLSVSFIKLSHHITQIPHKNKRMFLNKLFSV